MNETNMTELNRTIRDQRRTIGGLKKKLAETTKLSNHFRDTKEKLREERDFWKAENGRDADRKQFLADALQSARQEIERLKEHIGNKQVIKVMPNGGLRRIDTPHVREQKLIDGLCVIRNKCADAPAYRVEADVYKIASDLLQEIGVTVE